ncbi:hypothetical protein SAMN04488696_0640 [Methanolobus profundi]|uniref:Uncharacterized protein n=1 Tax=Methanolobus profundi TaxID=487685 RepID=A0A1I4PGL5_9EURY|nr:hypothetical protein SAMN04488696_0640 [Methanolobus profundi]
MDFEDKSSKKKVEMKTISDFIHISHVHISWKEYFKLCFSFSIVMIIFLVLLVIFVYSITN